MKKLLLLSPIIFIVGVIVFLQFDKQSASPIAVNDSIKIDSLNNKLDSSIESLDSLKPIVARTIQKIKYYENLRDDYQKQEAIIVYRKDTGELIALRKKLTAANNEIARLNGELASVRYKPTAKPRQKEDYASFVQPEIETPDENSIVITLDGRSKKGNIPTDNLTIYLVPYSKKNKSLMRYDSSCSDLFAITAKYYNGVYFFNNVQEGKYIIKICTYFGNYKLVKKQEGKQNVSMQVSPPIQ